MAARRVWWLSAAVLMTTSCLLDDNHCGENQVELKDVFQGCVCATNAVPNANGIGCHMCGSNEEVKGAACACKAGYSKASAAAECMPIEDAGTSDAGTDAGSMSGPATKGQDSPCSTDTDCASFDATFCQNLQAPSVCLVSGCANGTHHCAADRECCEITVLPSLAAAHGLCVPQGTCKAPGTVVTP